MKFASAQPYTEAERNADDDRRWKVLQRAVIRRQSAPRGHYNVQPTEADKRLSERLMGELDD
jgi:hypothetical protein